MIEVADRLELGHPSGEDPVLDLLVAGDGPGHLLRLRTAIADYDALTIATIHGFAAQVRNALGITTGLDPDARLVDETDELIGQVCADVLAAAAMEGQPPEDLPTAERLRRATRHALGRPGIRLEPDAEEKGATAAQVLLRDLVDQAVTTIADRQRMSGTVSFDGVVSDLWNVLDGSRSTGAIESIRSRFKVALIDEFQDTDPVQWKIFRKLFGERADGSLVLVGDPKQAIYGFRGGDIETYVAAVNDTAFVERRSMSRNWRSDTAVITALDALFAGATFGDEAIRFQPVVAAREPRPGASSPGAATPSLHFPFGWRWGPASIEPEASARWWWALRPMLSSGIWSPGCDGSSIMPICPTRGRARGRCGPTTSLSWSTPTRSAPRCGRR